MKKDKTSNVETLETDIAVLGGGGAGLAAAVAAGKKGADVIVLEKRATPGGNSKMAWGLFAAESSLQKRMRIKAPRDKIFQVAMDYAHWKINPRIVRAFIDKSADTIQWLEDMGVKFNFIPPLYSDEPFRTWHCPDEKRRSGNKIIKNLVKSCDDMGVRLRCKTSAKKILLGENGAVTGVLAVSGGKEFRIDTRSALIRTGGFAGNKGLLKKHCPSYSEDLYLSALPHMGDGLLMATEIGSATEGLGVLLSSGPTFPTSRIMNSIVQEPNTVWVNKHGERFVNEKKGPLYYSQIGSALERQPGKISYTLLDEKIKQDAINKGIVEGRSLNLLPQTRLVGLEEELHVQEAKGKAKISDSWEGIAEWMGASPEVLEATIVEYNFFCDRGHDEIFVKDRAFLQALSTPPYYAIRGCLSFHNTIGGIKINERMEVVNEQSKPIAGLYAAGVDTGGWQWGTYNFLLAGAAFGFAINSGRIAGENATKYISGE